MHKMIDTVTKYIKFPNSVFVNTFP